MSKNIVGRQQGTIKDIYIGMPVILTLECDIVPPSTTVLVFIDSLRTCRDGIYIRVLVPQVNGNMEEKQVKIKDISTTVPGEHTQIVSLENAVAMGKAR